MPGGVFPFGDANIGIFSLTIAISLQFTLFFITFEPMMTNSDLHQTLLGAKWVFFDLDDTLYDFAACSNEALRKLYAAHGELKSIFNNFGDFSDAYHTLNSELWRLYHANAIERSYLKTERFGQLLRQSMPPAEARALAQKLDEEYLWLLSEQGTTVAGAFETLRILSKHYLIGILSNGFIDTQYRKLRHSGLDRYVQRMVVSDEIGIQKPAKAIFDHALRETGADEETSVMIGDNPETDIKGAIEAGWKDIYFNPHGAPYDGAAPQIRSLTELIRTT